ncbi:hypothetical protein PSTG_05024 [Puccinia striiformis f. sp. tritici PST-78]|uniref:Uncharacterized protein n=1 Tax=Puccinia striiformis f. sp. tritici PST-78 TaxID=1165861 RepID=A0A0L0VQP1_9BASI|nr:hypothetical protein PSTG_05024 [Puccinia striiformis f. sp. tritici PST-78]
MREERNGNWPLEALSNAEITLYKTHYINIQQNLLPTLKVELTELLEAFDVQDSLGGNGPDPDLELTLQIIDRIGYALDQLEISINLIAPMPFFDSEPSFTYQIPPPNTTDEDRGIVKTHRCQALQSLILPFIADYLLMLFWDYERLIEARRSGIVDDDHSHLVDLEPGVEVLDLNRKIIQSTRHASLTIDHIIHFSRLSDFAMVQKKWRTDLKLLATNLALIVAKLGLYTSLKEDEEYAHLFVGQGDHQEEEEEEEEEEGAADHQLHSSTFLNPGQITLIKLLIPILKILRTFYNKLMDTPTRKTPFVIEGMSSSEYDSLKEDSTTLSSTMNRTMDVLWSLNTPPHDDDHVSVSQSVHTLVQNCRVVLDTLDSCLVSIRVNLVPRPSSAPASASELFAACFFDLRTSLHLAVGHFRDALLDYNVRGGTQAQL